MRIDRPIVIGDDISIVYEDIEKIIDIMVVSIYINEGCTLSINFKGLCALYTII